mmetsp:Transcript_77999/g.129112  ORF Transcript_77999/g.129112 Transcript_77999/m.129112 type:complete len:330 (+) Transcript_77999:1593-2582(+)
MDKGKRQLWRTSAACFAVVDFDGCAVSAAAHEAEVARFSMQSCGRLESARHCSAACGESPAAAGRVAKLLAHRDGTTWPGIVLCGPLVVGDHLGAGDAPASATHPALPGELVLPRCDSFRLHHTWCLHSLAQGDGFCHKPGDVDALGPDAASRGTAWPGTVCALWGSCLRLRDLHLSRRCSFLGLALANCWSSGGICYIAAGTLCCLRCCNTMFFPICHEMGGLFHGLIELLHGRLEQFPVVGAAGPLSSSPGPGEAQPRSHGPGRGCQAFSRPGLARHRSTGFVGLQQSLDSGFHLEDDGLLTAACHHCFDSQRPASLCLRGASAQLW